MIKKLIKKKILNNKWINPLLKAFNLDAVLNDLSQDYIDFKPDRTKSLQEIAGYSNKPEINSTLSSIHEQLISTVETQRASYSGTHFNVLDIGCGPGLYLQNFKEGYDLTGIDISNSMCLIAKEQVPSATIIHDHFLNHHFEKKFDAVYSIGVLIYFSKTQVDRFFTKIHNLLNTNGIVFISYPHAFREKDLSYHDYTYVHYSPEYLEKIVSPAFEIIHHMHQDQKTRITDFDRNPLINQTNYDSRSYFNSSILILRKK